MLNLFHNTHLSNNLQFRKREKINGILTFQIALKDFNRFSKLQ